MGARQSAWDRRRAGFPTGVGPDWKVGVNCNARFPTGPFARSNKTRNPRCRLRARNSLGRADWKVGVTRIAGFPTGVGADWKVSDTRLVVQRFQPVLDPINTNSRTAGGDRSR